MRGGRISRPAPPQGTGPQHFPILGVPFYVYTLCRRTTQFDVVTHMGRELLGGQPRPLRRGWSPSVPQFGGSSLFMAHPLNAEQPRQVK